MAIILRSFDAYRIEYGITNPFGKDLARIDLLLNETKAGQILFGSAIAPGAFASLINEDEIHLFFSLSHFNNLIRLFESHSPLSLFVEVGETPDRPVARGGIVTRV